MPLYVYRCNSCGETFEKRMSFSEADQVPLCPHCNSPQTQKQIATFAALGSSGGSSSGGGSCGGGSGRFT